MAYSASMTNNQGAAEAARLRRPAPHRPADYAETSALMLSFSEPIVASTALGS